MVTITASMVAGSVEEQHFFPHFHPVDTTNQALEELHGGHDIMLSMSNWPFTARQILLGLGASEDWADDVVSRAVEFRRIPA